MKYNVQKRELDKFSGMTHLAVLAKESMELDVEELSMTFHSLQNWSFLGTHFLLYIIG